MNLQDRIKLLSRLRNYISGNENDWLLYKQKAQQENGWFIPEFIDKAIENIAEQYLDEEKLTAWANQYQLPEQISKPLTVGIVMAGNIPLVGFHDLLAVFISGHCARIKPSSKDRALITGIISKLVEWDPAVAEKIVIADMLKGCDAYIATGSKNSAGYFDYYFGKYPNLIRKNKTSVAIITPETAKDDLNLLADDVLLYFGLGCRNVTKIYVPENYDFIPLLNALKKYPFMADHHKLKNNYDYNLALHILNKKEYMSNEQILLVEEKNIFAPVSQLNFEFYNDMSQLKTALISNPDIQCIAGDGFVNFGRTQIPELTEYADGADTMAFLQSL